MLSAFSNLFFGHYRGPRYRFNVLRTSCRASMVGSRFIQQRLLRPNLELILWRKQADDYQWCTRQFRFKVATSSEAFYIIAALKQNKYIVPYELSLSF